MEQQKKFKIKPPYIAAALLVLSFLLDYIFPEFRFVSGNLRYLGILILIFGLSITLYSFYLFKKNKTPIIPGKKPTFVVMEWPYSFTRNPMYLGVTITLAGASVYIGNFLAFLSPVIFFMIMNYHFVPFEENLMEQIFKKQYLNYKKKVRRWI